MVDLQNIWTIATKDFGIFMRRKSIIFSMFIIPLALSIGLPTLIALAKTVGNLVTPIILVPALDALSFFFIILATVVPVVVSSYSFVGEKIEKTLEPLLATPTDDTDILLGKCIVGLLPTLFILYSNILIFMGLMDVVTVDIIGYPYFPNAYSATCALIAPLASILSIEFNIIVSSRVNDIRTAEHLGLPVVVPFGIIFLLSGLRAITLNASDILVLGAILLAIDGIFFFIAKVTFRREAILTKWK